MKGKFAENRKTSFNNMISSNTCQYSWIKFETNYKLEIHMTMHQDVNSCGISSFPSRRLSKHEKGDERILSLLQHKNRVFI